MSVLPVGFGSAVNGGYQIERSLRFNSADTAYLNRTPASAGNRKTWTWSGWVKRSKLGTTYTNLFGVSNSGSNAGFNVLTFGSNGVADTLGFQQWTSTYRTTTQVFRDVGGWLHIVCALDTTQATGADRVKLYVNGSQITAFSTSSDPTQNSDLVINSNVLHSLGRDIQQSVNFDGYMTEVYFIDGQALTPSSFGETDTNTGVWKPKAFSGTYGTNGFYLKFADNSGTTSTTLGKDSSGNGNNWTPNNFSVTAGAGNDSLVDSPTSYGTDSGLGAEVRGNYCTLNPLAPYTMSGTVTLSNGNLQYADSASSYGGAVGTIAVTTGKWYWEVTATTCPGNWGEIGVSQAYLGAHSPGSVAGSYAYQSDGKKFINGTASAYGASYTSGDVIGVALDMDAGTLVFYKNNSSQGTAITGLTGLIITPSIGDYYTLEQYVFNANFGQRAFAYTAPSGFKALCTQNLPPVTIGATSTTQANDYFNIILYTGTGSSNAQTGVGFQPDLVWIKGRSGATDHGLYDAVRGVQKQLESNTNVTAETTETTGLTAFGSDGFTVGALAQLNTNTATYVAWNWNAGGSNQTISVGQYATSPANVPSIASTVRANTTSGFSIVTYTGNGTSGATIGHGLGAVPSFYIVKNRGSANKDWECYHISLGNTNRIRLNVTAAADTGGTMWANTTPTNTVFSVGADADVNASTNTYVAYCFAPVAGYSAFGSYTGNGSTDGPFVYTGFRPRWLLRKRYDAGTTSDWQLIDTAREEYNPDDSPLWPNLSNAQSPDPAFYVDMLSNGFKLRGTTASTNLNANGGTYIYAAFAEHPFKYSLAR